MHLTRSRSSKFAESPRYKWVALSNTTLGVLIVTINMSILLIALPDIFKGIEIDPLAPENVSYLLWLIMGYLVVTAVLVVSFGRLGDMYGRTKMYNLGFALFSVFSILLALTWMKGDAGAIWLISMRVLQGIGGSLLLANATAILTDAFPASQRGFALGTNSVAAIGGSFVGLIIGGVLAPVNWHLVFLVSVPIGVVGTIWGYLSLHDNGERHAAKIDWWGNLTFAVGLVSVLVGITYGLQPYGGHDMGWTNPWVVLALLGGLATLLVFLKVETKVEDPMFHITLFRSRAFAGGNAATLLAALGRGGLQFVLIMWLQGIWLPQHGYDFEKTPLWAGIYMVPLTIGFLIAGPLAGVLSDRFGTRRFAVVGMLLSALSFVLLGLLPVDFSYPAFAAVLALNGLAMGAFNSPNRAMVMNAVPANARGVGAGINATFMNAAVVLSIGIFFTLLIFGMSSSLEPALHDGLVSQGVPEGAAQDAASLPAVSSLFAALLGYNPMESLLGPNTIAALSPEQADHVTGRSFFPQLMSEPFADGLKWALAFAAIACVVAAASSWWGKDREPLVESRVGWLSGQVCDAAGTPIGAVVTLVPIDGGRGVGRVHTDDDGGYRIDPPGSGDYLLICSPSGADGPSPYAELVNVNGHEVRRDIVLAGAAAR